jgi:hypothetical protein
MISVMQATYTHFSTEIMIARRGDKYLELLMMVVVPFIPWMRWRAISLPVSLSPFLLALLFGTWARLWLRGGCLGSAPGWVSFRRFGDYHLHGNDGRESARALRILGDLESRKNRHGCGQTQEKATGVLPIAQSC